MMKNQKHSKMKKQKAMTNNKREMFKTTMIQKHHKMTKNKMIKINKKKMQKMTV
ncbi:hypothetical protein [Staphylococcus auricularis]|uniref:hypothetical protein n=1 Tax=Staphylococcus auricularis TaxID=29379 RepID=UPI001300BCA6|nr:hypothetical protein [Staphylococcus auricularis]